MAKKEASLTAKGVKYSKMTPEEVMKVVESNEWTEYDDWMGFAVNPNLTAKVIDKLFDRLAQDENSDKSRKDAIFRKREKNRNKVMDTLFKHPNVSESNKRILLKSSATRQLVIMNPSLTEEHLQLYFDSWVMRDVHGGYSFLEFEVLVKHGKQITEKLLSKWYETLKAFADWSYKNNNWYSIIQTYANHPKCPLEVLMDIASAPMGKVTKENPLPGAFSERYREVAANHKNATSEVRLAAYNITQDTKYLSQEARDVFLF